MHGLVGLQVKSKLGILSSYADAADGLITHGWLRKIEERGCFVHFYNGVQGFAPRLGPYYLNLFIIYFLNNLSTYLMTIKTI